MAKSVNSIIVTLGMLLLITGCGGGSGSSQNSNSTPPSSPSQPTAPDDAPLSERITLLYPTQTQVGESISLVANVASGAEITASNWQQLAGPTVSLLANRTQVVGFDVTQAGDYQFRYTATDASGDSTEQIISFTAEASQQSEFANVRLDHAVTEQGKVSLRVDITPTAQISSINWDQILGQAINSEDITTQGQLIFFDAPTVSKDELLAFEATVTTNTGSTLKDTAYVLVKNTEINNNGYFPDAADRIVNEDVYPYIANSQYANSLVPCIYSNLLAESCSFSQLPIIGHENNNQGNVASIEEIMQRVLVSHDWMAERFQQYLETSPVSEDVRRLLNAVTGVVISADVRPSFYWIATGAIYLDPANFWVTPEERDSLNDTPDFRSNFGQELQFIMPWRYVKDGQDYLNSSSYPQALRLQRSQEDVQADITWLLFHELAHANDFLPPSRHSSLGTAHSPLSFFSDNAPQSETLESVLRLQSQELKDLAEVSFRGTDASAEQRNYNAADITQFFEPDKAAMYYSYLTSREDYATLFEQFMMAHRLGVYSDVAVLSRNNNPQFNVTWGQRGRINDPQLRIRTTYVVNSIYPELAVGEILDSLAEPEFMIPGVSWFDNLMSNTQSNSNATRRASNNSTELQPIFPQTPRTIPNEQLLHHHFDKPAIPKLSKD